jgi:C-terminal processing protease CtpA/Prc
MVEPCSPAELAGIRPKDVFVEVDGTKFDATSTPDDVALKLRGPEGSKVGVVMERDGKTIDYIVTRQSIKITSVRSYVANIGRWEVWSDTGEVLFRNDSSYCRVGAGGTKEKRASRQSPLI